METTNVGMIGVQESRENVEALKKLYREEYKKIKDEQKQTNARYTKNKWRVRFGQLGMNIGLIFASKPVKFWGRITTNVAGLVTQKAMKVKNNIYNKNVEKRLKKLEADFIDLKGEFREFAIENHMEIEEIPDMPLQAAKAM